MSRVTDAEIDRQRKEEQRARENQRREDLQREEANRERLRAMASFTNDPSVIELLKAADQRVQALRRKAGMSGDGMD